MRALLELLSATIYSPAHAAKVPYVVGGTLELPPAIAANPDGTAAVGLRWRMVRIQAIDGVLLVTIDKGSAAAAPGTGSIRIPAGTSETFVLPDGSPSVNVAAEAGTVNGSLIWIR